MAGLVEFNNYLDYYPETGKVYWKKTKGPRAQAGQEITNKTEDGYLRVVFNGTPFLLSRVIWYMVSGRWPVEEIDHVNRVRDDNRLSNLREATRTENARNVWKSANKTRIANLYWCKRERKYLHYSSRVNGKRTYLGRYTTIEEARKAIQ